MDATTAMLSVNGRQEPLRVATLAALLATKSIAPDQRGLAVAVNGAVVPRTDWSQTSLHAGDAVEIVHARQGG